MLLRGVLGKKPQAIAYAGPRLVGLPGIVADEARQYPGRAEQDEEESEYGAGQVARPAGDVGLQLTRQYYLRVIAAREWPPGRSRSSPAS